MAYKVHAGPAELPNALVIEGPAGQDILPGKVVFKDAGDIVLGVAASVGQLLFAKEGGPGQGGKIDTVHVGGSHIEAYKARQGLLFRARLATGLTLVDGETELERAASGRLTTVTSGTPVAVARASVTTSADDQLVLVEVL